MQRRFYVCRPRVASKSRATQLCVRRRQKKQKDRKVLCWSNLERRAGSIKRRAKSGELRKLSGYMSFNVHKRAPPTLSVVRADESTLKTNILPTSEKRDQECILNGDRGSLAALLFCLCMAGLCMHYVGASDIIQAATDVNYCQDSPLLADTPNTTKGASWLDQHLVESKVYRGQLGLRGRLGEYLV